MKSSRHTNTATSTDCGKPERKIKDIRKKFSSIIIAAVLACSVTAAGCASSAPDAPEAEAPAEAAENADDGTAPADEEPQDTAAEETSEDAPIVLTNFSGGVLVDEEDGDHCEFTSMGMTDLGYQVEYNMSRSDNSGQFFYDLQNLTVNGVLCGDALKDPVFGSDSDIYPHNAFVIDKQWLDDLGITEVRSLTFTLEIGSVSYSSFTSSYAHDFAIYTGAEDTQPYEPVLSEGSKVIYEDDEFRLILLNAHFIENETRFMQNLGLLYINKAGVDGYVRPASLHFGDQTAELHSMDYNHEVFQLAGTANAQYLTFQWSADKDTVDPAAAQLEIQKYSYETYESTSYMTDLDLSGYPTQ